MTSTIDLQQTRLAIDSRRQLERELSSHCIGRRITGFRFAPPEFAMPENAARCAPVQAIQLDDGTVLLPGANSAWAAFDLRRAPHPCTPPAGAVPEAADAPNWRVEVEHRLSIAALAAVARIRTLSLLPLTEEGRRHVHDLADAAHAVPHALAGARYRGVPEPFLTASLDVMRAEIDAVLSSIPTDELVSRCNRTDRTPSARAASALRRVGRAFGMTGLVDLLRGILVQRDRRHGGFGR